MTSRPTQDYKYKQQLKHPRRYAPIRPEQWDRFHRNRGASSVGIEGRNQSEQEGGIVGIRTLLDKQDFHRAKRLAHFLYELDSGNNEHLFRTGQACFLAGDYQSAITSLKELLLMAPESPRSADLMDKAFHRLNDPEGLQAAWAEIASAHPEAIVPREHLDMFPR